MKIVHVSPFYSPVIGGVQEVSKMIAEYSSTKGDDVYVLTYNRLSSKKASLPEEEYINGVNVIRLKPAFLWSYGSYSSELPVVLTKLKPDIVHVHVWRHPHCFQVAKLKKRFRFKAILHSHAPFHKFSQLGFITFAYHRTIDSLMKNYLRQYDQLIALTPFEKNVLVQKLGAAADKVVIVPNGIPDKLFAQSVKTTTDKNSILFLGRFSKEKNLKLLVKSLVWVKKEITPKLFLVGPDEGEFPEVKSFLEKHEIDFHYLGAITTDAAKAHMYGKCSVFVQPSLYEAFGITLLEAQLFGKPCIITGEGGQTYVAPPGFSSLHPDPNPESYGRAIVQLLSDSVLYEKLSRNAKMFATMHLWSKILPMYYVIYKKLLNVSVC